jgi:hypothetical protein
MLASIGAVFFSACRHRHGGVASSGKDYPAPSAAEETQNREEGATTEVVSSEPKADAEPMVAREPLHTKEEVDRVARVAGAPDHIVIPKDIVGTYTGHKHRAGKERLEGETCTITADKQLSLSILEDGKATWSGLTFLDLRCPGDEKDKPVPLHCWYEGQGIVWKGAGNKYEIRATLGKKGPIAAASAFRVYKCKKGEVVLDRRWNVDLPSDCVAVESSDSSGSPEGTNCSWSNEFKQLQEGAFSIIATGRIEVPVLMAGPSSMTLDRVSTAPAGTAGSK